MILKAPSANSGLPAAIHELLCDENDVLEGRDARTLAIPVLTNRVCR